MAITAYIDYNKMIALSDEVARIGEEITTLFETEILQNRYNEVQAAYNGEAAEAYAAEVKSSITRVQQDIQKLVEDIRTEANTQKQAWESQDKAAASVAG